MKTVLLLLVLLPLVMQGQIRTDSRTKSMIIHPSSDEANYRRIGVSTYVPVLALTNDKYSQDLLPEGILEGSSAGRIVTLYIRKDIVSQDMNIPGVEYLEWAGRVQPMLDKVAHDIRLDSVRMSWNLPLSYTGKDVIIGITDWGFDYTHPMFYDTLLQHTRILKAWDQFREAGPAPSGFLYGSEFDGESELLAAQCDTFNIYQFATHGSHVAGIAGGSGAGTIYRGVACEASYLFATFLVDAAAVLDAYNWMYQNAQASGKRLVINQSWGLYYMGNLDGTSLLSQAIDALSDSGVVFVSSAGNNGDADFHIAYQASSSDTMKTVVGFDSYAYYSTMWGQCVTLWGTPGAGFGLRARVLNSSGASLVQTPLFFTDSAGLFLVDTLIIGTDSVFYNVTVDSANYLNQRPFIQFKVANRNTAYKVALEVFADSGTVHMWNVIELTNGVGNWGLPFLAPFSGYIAGDPHYGVGEPACAHSAIAVAAHAAEYHHPTNGSLLGGGITYFSSYGPLINGSIKPDISAPGSAVVSSISSFTSQTFNSTEIIETVSFGGRNYRFVRFSGTSMSSPVVTGIVALMLQADPTLTPAEIKTILQETSREDSKTGDLPETGDTRWGWGKADALNALYRVLGVEGFDEVVTDKKVLLYPNPATDQLWIKCFSDEVVRMTITDMTGRNLFEYRMGNDDVFVVSVSELRQGVYFVHLFDLSGLYSVSRFVKN